jgi:four helix bundle protein
MVGMARDFRNLQVFGDADALFFRVLATSATLQVAEAVILCNQLRRASLSIPVNLVEGSQRSTTREYRRFVEIAAGSAAETRYLLSVAARLTPEPAAFTRLEREYESLTRRLQTLRERLGTLPDASSSARPRR